MQIETFANERSLIFKAGSRCVISSRNGSDYPWSSRLYVNNGETATLTSAKHNTTAGAAKWAKKVLERHCTA